MLSSNNSRETSLKKSVDWITISLYVILVFFGWLSIYGASYDYDQTGGILDFSQRYGKQLIWIGLAGIIAICILLLDNRVFDYFAYYIYAALILLLIATVFLATEIKGSRSWLSFGAVSLQPAEIAKFAVALALAKYMNSYNFKLGNIKNALVVGLLIFTPFAIIIMQNETGTALVYLAFMLVLYREGMPGIFLFLGFWSVFLFIVSIQFLDDPIIEGQNGLMGNFLAYIAIIVVQIILTLRNKKKSNLIKYLFLGNVVLFLVAFLLHKTGWVNVNFEYVALFSIVVSVVLQLIFYFWKKELNCLIIVFFLVFSVGYCYSIGYFFDNVLQPYQQMRIKVSLGIEDDPSGVGYNVNQSEIAIGSGGLYGKGFLSGTQTKLKYVPEQDTDFIFCTIGEEFGFLGTSAVLLLFLFLLLRLIVMAERQRSLFCRIYGYSVVSMLFFHVVINVGMVIGLTPVIGIPLPFFSYGGSSLWGFTVLLFVFIRMDMSRMELWSN